MQVGKPIGNKIKTEGHFSNFPRLSLTDNDLYVYDPNLVIECTGVFRGKLFGFMLTTVSNQIRWR